MVSRSIKHYVYELDAIEVRVRRKIGCQATLYVHFLSMEYMRYWRHLQKNHSDEIKGRAWDELYFFFNQQLFEHARHRLDLYWMIFDLDETPLFFEGHEPKPFWR